MKSIFYEVPLVKQGLQECLQASITQLLNYYKINKTIEQVKQQIPVYISKKSKPLGTSIGHAATYLIKEGFNTTLHVVDIEIFDRSWDNLNNKDLMQNLCKRKKFASTINTMMIRLVLFLTDMYLFLMQEVELNSQLLTEVIYCNF